jgi:hypothetical protein
MGDVLLNSTSTETEIIDYTAITNEIFRISIGWYTPPGGYLENVAGIQCIRAGITSFNYTDYLNTLGRMTIHLSKNQNIVCKIYLVREATSSGFYVSVATSSWPTFIVYTKEDVNGTDYPNPLYGLWISEIQSNMSSGGTDLVRRAWVARDLFRDLFNEDPLIYVGFLSGAVFIGTVIYLVCLGIGEEGPYTTNKKKDYSFGIK